MNIISKLPENIIDIWANVNGYYYNPLGFRVKKDLASDFSSKKYFLEIEENCLICYEIIVNILSDEIIFDKKETWRLVYNESFNEIEKPYDNFELDKRTFLNTVHNGDVLLIFLIKLLNYQDFDISDIIMNSFARFKSNSANIMNVFIKNGHKLIPLILETGNERYLRHLFEGYITFPDVTKLNKKILCFANELGIGIPDAITLHSKFNPELLRKLHTVLSTLKLYEISNTTPESIFSIVANTNIVNLNDYCNYIIKSIFINNNIDIRSLGKLTQWVPICNLSEFLILYRDYSHMIDVNSDDVDLYPENLEIAHHAAVERQEMEEDKKIDKEQMTKFSLATEQYKSLAFKNDKMEVIIPSRPLDLINESKKLHHCVRTYIDAVCNGQTIICLVRKEGEPYITVEINNNNEIVQAKKAFNKLPNDEDTLFLKEWSNAKNLKIRSY